MSCMQEVAVKRFLDQDFFGDALDEFISEVKGHLSSSILIEKEIIDLFTSIYIGFFRFELCDACNIPM